MSQKRLHLAANIGAIGRRRRFLSCQQLGNVGLRYLDGRSEIALLGRQFFETLSDEEREIQQPQVLARYRTPA